MIYVLDTDTAIWVLRRQEPWRSRVDGRPPGPIAVTSMTEAELRFGALHSADVPGNLARLDRFLSGAIAVLPFDRAAAWYHAEIRHALRAQRIGERDFVIASTVLANKATLVTGNVREFGRVPGLSIEDWSVPVPPA